MTKVENNLNLALIGFMTIPVTTREGRNMNTNISPEQIRKIYEYEKDRLEKEEAKARQEANDNLKLLSLVEVGVSFDVAKGELFDLAEHLKLNGIDITADIQYERDIVHRMDIYSQYQKSI